MKKSTADILLTLTGGIFALSSLRGSFAHHDSTPTYNAAWRSAKNRKWADISEAEFQHVREYVDAGAPLGAIADSIGMEEEELKRGLDKIGMSGISPEIIEALGGDPFDHSDTPFPFTIKKLPPITQKRKPLSDEQRDLQSERNFKAFLDQHNRNLDAYWGTSTEREPIDHDPFANRRFK